MTTVNMVLDLPVVSLTASTTWATMLNTALELVDTHDHTSNKGVAVPTAGLNINATLPMNANDVSELNSALFENRSADISLTRGVYVKSGELFFKDHSGNVVQLTNAGSIAGTNGSFTGLSSPAAATYASGSKLFTYTYDSAKLARQAIGDLLLYPYDASTAYTKQITLKAPTALEAASSYSITLPSAVPGAVEYLSMDTSGVVNHATLAGTTNQVNVSASATAIVLSLPQSVHTAATPTFQSMTINNGTASAPTLTFQGDTNTGIYSATADNIEFTTAGTKRLNISTDGITPTVEFRGPVGTVGSPSFAFDTDRDTGIYRVGADSLGIAAAGANVSTFSATGLAATALSVTGTSAHTGIATFSAALRSADGSNTVPSYSFTNSTNTGVFYEAGPRVVFVTAGGRRMSLSATGVTMEASGMTIQGKGDATVTAPAFTFDDDTNSGIYKVSADKVGFASGGRQVGYFYYDGTDQYVTASNSVGGRVGFQVAKDWGTTVNWTMTAANSSSDTDLFFIPSNGGATSTAALVLSPDGSVFVPNHGTTTSGANARISPSTNELLRDTSSIQYKQDVDTLVDWQETVSKLRPVIYRSKLPADDTTKFNIGLIAEEVDEVDSRLVEYSGKGDPNGVRYERLSVVLLAAVQDLRKRIEALGG